MKKLYFLLVLFVLISLRIQGQVVFSESFDDGAIPSGWTIIDADGDDHNWMLKTNSVDGWNVHSGDGCVASASWDNGVLSPDNWLITPYIELPEGAVLSFWVSAHDQTYVYEHWGIYISTDISGGTSTENFTLLQPVAQSAPAEFEQVNMDLSDYAGQIVRIAFRHFECTDQYWLNIDDVTITGQTSCELMLTYYVDPANQLSEGDWLSIFAGDEYVGGVSWYDYSYMGNNATLSIPVQSGVALDVIWHEPDATNHNTYFILFDPSDQQVVFRKEFGMIVPDGEVATYTPTCGELCTGSSRCPLQVSMTHTPGSNNMDYLNINVEGMDCGFLVLTPEQSSLDTTLYFCSGRHVEMYYNGGSNSSCTITDSYDKTTEFLSYGGNYMTNDVCSEQCELVLNYGSNRTFSTSSDDEPWLSVYAGDSQIPYYVFDQSNWEQYSYQTGNIPISANTPLRFVWHDPDPTSHSVWFDIFDPTDDQLVYSKVGETFLADGQFVTYTPTCGTYCSPVNQCPLTVSIERLPGTTGGDYVLNFSGGGLDYGENYYSTLTLPAGESQLDTVLMFCPERYVEIIPASWETRTDIVCTVTDANANMIDINNTENYVYNHAYTSYNACATSCELYMSIQVGSSVTGDDDWRNSYFLEVFAGNDQWPSQVFMNSQLSPGDYMTYPIRATAGTPLRFVWHEPDVDNHSTAFVIVDPMNGTEIVVKNAGDILPDGQIATYTSSCEVDPIVVESVSDITMNSAMANIYINTDGLDNYDYNQQLSYGICWATSNNPVLGNSFSQLYTMYGWEGYVSSMNMSNLSSSTTYYVRGFVIFNQDTMYSNELSFTTLSCGSVVEEDATVCSEYIVYNNMTLLSEGFEGGSIPAGWTQSGSGSWTVGTGDYSSNTGAHTGAYNARRTHGTTNSTTKLCTPQFAPTVNGQLTFWYVNRSWSGDIDQLRVYYQSEGDDTWQNTSLYTATSAHSTWTLASVTLPENTVRLAFEMTDQYGYGVGLDDIRVETSQYVGTFTETGTYTYTRSNEYNCVDTVMLHLTVLNNLPQVHTYNVENITAESADGWGEIEGNCGLPITESGLCYSTEHNPTIESNRVVNMEGGSYIYAQMTGLNEGTTYYMRAYATNSAGTAYGEEVSFTTLSWATLSGTVTDYNTGNPIAGAYVSIYYYMGNNPYFVTSVVTDNNGDYTVSGIYSGNYTVIANASGYDMLSTLGTLQGGTNTMALSLTPEECRTPVNVDYELLTDAEGTSLKLSWEMSGDTISQETSTENGGTYGIGSQYSIGVYHLFTPEQLVAYNGGVINSVGAWFSGRYEYTTYTLRIWTGGNEYEGPTSTIPAYEQVVNPEGIAMNAWNDIVLNTPFAFDGTQCLWVGFHVDCNGPENGDNNIHTIGFTDYYNVTTGHYGNVMYLYDDLEGWYWVPNTNLPVNWMIRAVVVPNALTYNVYENETPIATGVEDNSYMVSPYNPQQEQTCYQVAANCVNGQTSGLSACATVMQTLATVVTGTVENIGTTYATCSGEVVADGNSTIVQRGFCWATMEHPSLLNFYMSVDMEGDFVGTLPDLMPNTTYYVRAFATNSLGTAYGNELVFTTLEQCYEPMNLAVSDVVSSSAYITWQNNSENNNAPEYYELQYKAADDVDWTTISNITDEYYMLTGLTHQTSYMVRVRAVCAANRESVYSDIVSFTTLCVSGSPEVIIGVSTNTSNGNVIPVMYNWYYSYSQQIYDASEINGARTIDHLELQYYYATAYTWNVDIYLGHTNKSVFSSSSDYIPVSDLTLVYSGDITFNNSGENYWFDIPLTTAFEYNGTDNLVLAVDNNTHSWSVNSGFYTHPTSDHKTIYAYTDGSDINPSSVSGNNNWLTYRNNLRLPGACINTGCDRANVVVREVTDSSASLMYVAGSGSNTVVMEYKEAGSDEYTAFTASESPYTLTGLKQNTAYEVRICSVCGNDSSEWKTATFTTGVKYVERLYVKANGTGEGGSWNDAAGDVNWALSTADAVYQLYGVMPEIWVAAGVYYGNTSGSIAFAYTTGTKLYGGFAGYETELSQRDYNANVTVLDGQNNRQVLASQSPTSYSTTSVYTIIDGFTIRNGNSINATGGGVYINNGNTRLSNCIITNNTASNGGGVYANSWSNNYHITIDRCTITNNTAANNGGGVYAANVIIKNSSVINNTVTYSYGYGGGIYTSGVDTIVNCLVAGNNASYGAGLYFTSYDETVINTTIVENSPANTYGSGAGVYASGSARLVNSVIWGNKVNGIANNTYGSNYTFEASAVEGMSGYTGVIELQSENLGNGSGLFYPAFVSPEAGDYRLQNQSALIDAGSSNVPVDSLDLSGLSRFYGDAIDIGCYESHGEVYCTKPYNLAAQDMTGSSVVLTWLNGSTEQPNHYELSYKADGTDTWTVVAEELHDNYYMLGGLQAQTNYLARVRSICGGESGDSPYSDVLNFTTACVDLVPEVVVGEGSTNTYYYNPIYFYSYYSLSQQIYKAAEIGEARTIDHLQLQYFYGSSYTKNIEIYLGHTDQTSFTSSSAWVPVANLTKVYDNTITFNNSGEDYWLDIPLSESFAYNGTQNLVVMFYDKTGSNSYNSYGKFYTHNTEDNLFMYRTSSSEIDLSNLSSGSRYKSRNNLRIPAGCLTDACPQPNVAVMDITDSSAVLVFAEATGTDGYELEYREVGSNTYEQLTATSPYLWTGLRQNAEYEVRIRSLCGDTAQSHWKTVNFATPAKNLNRLYVNATGTGDASSWQNASGDLAWTLRLAQAIKEQYETKPDVWVAAGTYVGDSVSLNAFTMLEGVNVYGGFEGNEPDDYDLSLRDFTAHASILDGQHSQRVLYQSAEFNDNTVWDGFTLQHGYASSNNTDYGRGAGAFLRQKGILSHCRIVDNNSVSGNGGGGVYATSNAALDHCVISGNVSSGNGGGIYANSYVTLDYCTISDNHSNYEGGGVYAYEALLRHCKITHNTASESYGGGIYLAGDSYNANRHALSNCLIAKNTAYYVGGVYCYSYGNIYMDNTTIVENNATQGSYFGSAGLFNNNYQIYLQNVVVWGNRNTDNDAVSNVNEDNIVYQYCAVEGGVENNEDVINLDSDNFGTVQGKNYPFFVSPSTMDYRLRDISPLVNAGSNELVADTVDLGGGVRVYDDIVDIGCYEYHGELICAEPTNLEVNNVTGDAAMITWQNSNPDEPDHYELAYQLAGASEWTVLSNDWHNQYYMLSGLQTQSTYNVRVRTACDGEHISDYVELSFSTNCSGDFGTELTIGENSTYQTSELPIYTYYATNSYSQQIYLASEIGGPRIIDTLKLQYYYSSSLTRNIDIYLGHTSKTAFLSGNDWVPQSELVLVYSGNVTFNNSGENYWMAIPLDSVFDYDGLGNLVMVFHDKTGGNSYYNSTGFYCQQIQNDYRSMYYSAYNTIDPASPNSGYLMNQRNNLRLSGYCVEGGCSRSNIAVTEVTDSSALLVYTAGTGAVGLEMEYCEAGDGTYTPLSSEGGSYRLTGLRQNTQYRVRVRSVCAGEETSRWYTVDFTTAVKDLDHLYVTATGNGDASSWENASNDLTWTLDLAARIKHDYGRNVVVWMAAGTYYGDSVSTNAFNMVEGVNVYGGFAGNEAPDYDLSQRDFTANATILDGQGSQRVLYQATDFNVRTVWDGLTLQHGYTKSDNNISSYGGGAYLKANTSLINCRIVDNTSVNLGGGVYAYPDNTSENSIVLDNCTIAHNIASSSGGGVYARYTLIRHCDVSYNRSNSYGGGIYYGGGKNNGYVISNTLIANNTAAQRGGLHISGSNLPMTNLTVVNNQATTSYAGIYGSSSQNLYNSIVWGNKTNGAVDNLSGSLYCYYCAVEGVCNGSDNLVLMSTNAGTTPFYPNFVNPSVLAGCQDVTQNVDWHLQNGSICVNRGDNTQVSDSLDMDGNARIQKEIVDLGCYESAYYGIILPEYGNIIYVTQNGGGDRNGSSWDNALNSVSEALGIASMYDADVWVAAGTYYGDGVSANAFTMVEGVNVYGGFEGNEPENYDLSRRILLSYPTILDGQNSQRVLYQPNSFTQRTVWDGITLQHGNVTSNNLIGQYGAGAWLKGGVTLNNCRVLYNDAYSYGGGVYCETSSYNADSIYLLNSSFAYNTSRNNGGGGAYINGSKVLVDNCLFAYDTAIGTYGGGVYNSDGTIRNSTINHNTAAYGAGIHNTGSYANVSNSVITYNTASSQAGGVYLYYNSNVTVALSNCLVANNSAWGSGAGVYSSGNNVVRSSTIVRNSITGTSSDYKGAGVYSSGSNLTLNNSIVWGNMKNGDINGISGSHNASHVASDDGCNGENNLPLFSNNDAESMFSPHFVNPSVMAGSEDTSVSVNWRLAQGSPCVNRGDNSLAAEYDVTGMARVQQDTIDLGCYESPYNSIPLPTYDSIIYVVEGGAGYMTGESWANATGSLQDAVRIAMMNGARVWVAAGTYYGDGTSENAFVMRPRVNVYGGFAGNEAPDYDLSLRDFTANASVLDGQYTQRVLMQPEHYTASTAVVWDGFTIQNGQITGDGAGVYMQSYSTLRNCTVQNNTIASVSATNTNRYGAGIYANGNGTSQRAVISHCKVLYNTFANINNGHGGGIYANYADIDHTEINHNIASNSGGGVNASNSTVSNCVISYNTSQNYGGGLSNSYTNIDHTEFSYNTAQRGAGLMVSSVSQNQRKITNCLIHHNTSTQYGGGLYISSYCYMTFINCDFVNNSATGSGGGIYQENYNQPVYTNCIIWGNKKGYEANNKDGSGSCIITYCAVEGGYSGETNIELSPNNDGGEALLHYVRFIDPQNGDYQLHPTSSCINNGSDDVVTDALDFYGNARTYGDHVDIGCSEAQAENTCQSVINLTANNVTTNSAQLSWEQRGSETMWVVVYGETNSDVVTVDTAYTTSYAVQGLTFNRQYTAKVRAICDENAMSIFSIPVNFQTTCNPEELDTLPNFTQMRPLNDEVVYNNSSSYYYNSVSVDFSWDAMAQATSYDFYLWSETDNEPTTPSRSGLLEPAVGHYVLPNYTEGAVYYWKVVAWNECINKTSPTMRIRANWKPDLHVSGFEISTPVSTQPMDVTWTVTNDGQGNTPPGVRWNDYIWLTPVDGVGGGFWYNVSEVLLGQEENLAALNAGESYQNTMTVTIPEGYVGAYFLFVFTDQRNVRDINYSSIGMSTPPIPYTPSASGTPYPYLSGTVYGSESRVVETNDNDNFFYQVIEILPPPSPDLVVSSVVHAGTANAGYSTDVTWTVENRGEAAAMGSWTDVVYLSRDTILNTQEDLRLGRFVHEGTLAMEESYSRTESVNIPVDYVGDYYYIVVTDNNNNIYEGLMENNNKGVSAPLTVMLTWSTDLQVTAVSMPNVVDANGSYDCQYTVTNMGASPTYVSSWYDAVYLSRESTFDMASAQRLSLSRHYDVVNSNESYDNTINVTIPDTMSGSWYLYVVTDVNNEVFEYNADSNNSYKYSPALTVNIPDLRVADVMIPDVVNPNQPVLIQWAVVNDGPGNVVNRSFVDRFYFNGSRIYEASVTRVNIPVGDTMIRTATVRIPCYNANMGELSISTDYDNQIREVNDNNNTINMDLAVSTPDLAVNEISSVSSVNSANGFLWSGSRAMLSYTVTNNGAADATAQLMRDKIYFSTSATNYQDADLIGFNLHEVNIGVGESRTYTCAVAIPNGISGTYYYHVVCNDGDTICEGGNTYSNEGTSEAVEVQLSPSPDLVITSLIANPTEVYLGAGFELTYTIANQGTGTLYNTNLMQKFYYSFSPTAYDTLNRLATTYDYLNLAPGESMTTVLTVAMPINIVPGNYFIHAVTDANDQVYEHQAENNNRTVSNLITASVYQLDLQLTEITAPAVIRWGETATCTLHVHNNSEMPTLAPSWQDHLYLSTDNMLQSSDRLIQSVIHREVLEAGEDYEVEIQVTIPYGTSSTVYLIGITDYNGDNPDINTNNNILSQMVTIQSVPTVDLAVSEVEVLDEVYNGQQARIAYKVTNLSETPVEQQTWNDKLFVSYNNAYESIDLQLLTKDRRNISLAQDEFYRDTLTFTVPQPYNGSLYLLMMANANNDPYETERANNTMAVPVDVILPAPGDLVVIDVTCESRIVSGQTLHTSWKVQNIGDNPITGNGLRSLVYISADTVFDVNDRLLGSVTTNNVNLDIDATLQQNLNGRVSGLSAGDYYLIVKTDVTNAFNEVNDNNNTGRLLIPFNVAIRPLPFNMDVYDTLVNNEVSDYMLSVGDNVNQTVRIHVNSEDADLGAVNMIYATYNEMGNNLNYSYSTIGQYTSNAELYIPATQRGYYGVNIYGSTPTNQPQNTVVRADILPFELMGVNDDHGGNTGVTTVELIGSRFRPDMAVRLTNGTEEIEADSLIYVNYYQAYAQFDLTGRTPGTYDVVAENLCEGEAVLSNAFTIENGMPSGLSYNLLFPSAPRPNRTVVMMLEFGNIGNIDLHNQVVEITCVGGAPIALTPDELAEGRTVLRVPLSIEGEPAGLLRPGSYGTINIYGYTSGALIFTIKPVEE